MTIARDLRESGPGTRTVARMYALLVLGWMLSSSCFLQAESYIYLWYPRYGTVEGDAPILRALLQLVPQADYTIAPGDSVDGIVLTRFMVSPSDAPDAFSIYKARLLELNPGAGLMILPRQKLRLPVGPRYGGTLLDPSRVDAADRGKVFQRMSQKAQSTVNQANLQEHAVRTLQSYLPSGAGSGDAAWQAIKKLGMVAATPNIEDQPDEQLAQVQPLELTVTDQNRPFFLQLRNAETKSGEGRLLPASMPTDSNGSAQCSATCTSCRSALGFSTTVDLSKARLLIVDTGLAQAAQGNAPRVYPDGAWGDANADQHGTFVFNELAESGNGIFPEQQIYVAKALPDQQSTYSLADIVNSLTRFTNKMASDPTAPATWVANLSIFGEPLTNPTDTANAGATPQSHDPLKWSLPIHTKLLMVVSAGNADKNSVDGQGSWAAPVVFAFSRLADGKNNILSVGALSTDPKTIAVYSNYSQSNVQLLAQGDCLCGGRQGLQIKQLNGTSMAAPVVSAAAAILVAAHPDWTPSEIMWRLMATANRDAEGLRPNSLAGTVDINLALQTGSIRVRTTTASYDAAWVRFLGAFGQQLSHAEDANQGHSLMVLRLTDGVTIGSERHFISIRTGEITQQVVKVPLDSSILLQKLGSQDQVTVKAADLVDVILPIPRLRSGHFPDAIGVTNP